MGSLPAENGTIISSPGYPAVEMEDLTLTRSQVHLILTVAMCVVALLFVCLFTILLQLIVKHRNAARHQIQESASDYEVMNMSTGGLGSRSPGVPKYSCGPSDCNRAPPPPALLKPFDLAPGPKQHRRTLSACITVDFNEYAEVAVPSQTDHYQSLDVIWCEDPLYKTMHKKNQQT